MNDDPIEQVTRVLQEARAGRKGASKELLSLVYDELRRLAGSYMRRERANHTLQPTALVHEAYLRMIDQKTAAWEDRAHFFGVAAHVMRQVLVDHARRLNAAKRKKDRVHVTVERLETPSPQNDIDVVALDEALEKLAALDKRKSQVVELRFFAGLTLEEVAQVLGVSKRTAESDWFMARAWLRGEMGEG